MVPIFESRPNAETFKR